MRDNISSINKDSYAALLIMKYFINRNILQENKTGFDSVTLMS